MLGAGPHKKLPVAPTDPTADSTGATTFGSAGRSTTGRGGGGSTGAGGGGSGAGAGSVAAGGGVGGGRLSGGGLAGRSGGRTRDGGGAGSGTGSGTGLSSGEKATARTSAMASSASSHEAERTSRDQRLPDGSIIVSVASTAPGDAVRISARATTAPSALDAIRTRSERWATRRANSWLLPHPSGETSSMKTGGPDARAWASAVAPTGNHRRKTSNNPHFDDCLIAPPYRSKKTTLSVLRHTRSCQPISTIRQHDEARAPPITSLSVARAARCSPRSLAAARVSPVRSDG